MFSFLTALQNKACFSFLIKNENKWSSGQQAHGKKNDVKTIRKRKNNGKRKKTGEQIKNKRVKKRKNNDKTIIWVKQRTLVYLRP